VDNVVLLPEDTQGAEVAKEQAILTGEPVAVIEYGDLKLPIYPKPQGCFYKIEEATQEYLRALMMYERVTRKRWFGSFRRRVKIDAIERTKYNLLRLIFEDRYNEERHTDLTVAQFLTIPHDVIVAILNAYKDANDVEDILKLLIPNYQKQKKRVAQAITRSFTRQ